jgi:hypothetical protein
VAVAGVQNFILELVFVAHFALHFVEIDVPRAFVKLLCLFESSFGIGSL